MKKFILSITTAFLILCATTVFAAEINPGKAVKDAFSKEFSHIKVVQWDPLSKEGVYKASFLFNNETLQAFFTEEGNFLGTIRQVVKSQLPIMVIKELDQKYPGAETSAIFEYSKTDELSYYITLITNRGSMILKATGNGELTVHQRARK